MGRIGSSESAYVILPGYVTHMFHVEKVHRCRSCMSIQNKAEKAMCSSKDIFDNLWNVGSADEVGQLFQCTLITE